jgi:predicted phage replisome organizer
MSKVKRYFWLKFKRDFFNDLRIRKLQSVPGGDTYVLVFIKILTFSIPTSGIIVYRGIFPTLEEEIAMEIREDSKAVAFVLEFASKYNMLETMEQGQYYLKYAVENIGSEGASAQRMRKLRAKESNNEQLPSSQCDTSVTRCDKIVTLETDTDTEEDTHTDKELEIWLHEYSKNAKKPDAYKATMRKKITSNDIEALHAFEKWKDKSILLQENNPVENILNIFDFNVLIGIKFNGTQIINVLTEEDLSTVHIFFDDGSSELVSKKDIYMWYQLNKEALDVRQK